MDDRGLAAVACTAGLLQQHDQLPRVLQHTLDIVAAITAAPPDVDPGDAALERLRSSVYALKHSTRSAALAADVIDRVWCAPAPARAATERARLLDSQQRAPAGPADEPCALTRRATGPAPPGCGTTLWITTTCTTWAWTPAAPRLPAARPSPGCANSPGVLLTTLLMRHIMLMMRCLMPMMPADAQCLLMPAE
jgi:hypothetical protein